MINTDHLLLGSAIMGVALASCSADPIEQPGSAELYTREFISEFGAPARGHDFSMATSAGLKVATKTGGLVMVTAEVDGKEYLFASLTLPAGTHSLPVTIPRSVTSLKVSTPFASATVAPSATVDLDALMPRAAGKASRSEYYISYTDLNGNASGYMQGLAWDPSDSPLLAFNPADVARLFSEFTPGQDNTDYKKITLEDGTLDLSKAWGKDPLFNGETALGDGGADYEGNCGYYVFPLWWHVNRREAKDYQAYFFDWLNLSETMIPIDFGNLNPDGSNKNRNIPFPELGYSATAVDFDSWQGQDLSGFSFDDGDFREAYPIDGAKAVVSRGIKIEFDSHTNRTIGFALGSSFDASGYGLYTSSVPSYNRFFWGGSYYDVTLSNLFYALSGTKEVQVDGTYDGKFHFLTSRAATGWANLKDIKIVGFNSAPRNLVETDYRDYADALFLIVPIKSPENPTQVTQVGHWYFNPPRPLEWTVAAEDLAGDYDWDFNDAVFKFTDVITDLKSVNRNNFFALPDGPTDAQAMRIITVTPLAAGGTVPLYITYRGSVTTVPDLPDYGDEMYCDVNQSLKRHLYPDGLDDTAVAAAERKTYIIGCELHRWLGAASSTKALNVGGSREDYTGQPVQFVIPTGDNPYLDGQYDRPLGMSDDNMPLFGFSILVDKKDALGYHDLSEPFRYMENLTLGTGSYTVGRPKDDSSLKAPQMILVQGDWEWPRERVKILNAYPDFSTWIANPSTATDWHTANKNSAYVTGK